MDSKLKANWIKALRSGKFKQGRSTLRSTSDSGSAAVHCCLGVLCEVIIKKKILPLASTNKGYSLRRQATCGGLLSKDILSKINLRDEQQRRLAELNDRALFDFDKIANYIEKHI